MARNTPDFRTKNSQGERNEIKEIVENNAWTVVACGVPIGDYGRADLIDL